MIIIYLKVWSQFNFQLLYMRETKYISVKYNNTGTWFTKESSFKWKHLGKWRKKGIFICAHSRKLEQMDGNFETLCISFILTSYICGKKKTLIPGSSVYDNISQRRQVRGDRLEAFGGTGNLRESRLDLTSDRVRFGGRPIVVDA